MRRIFMGIVVLCAFFFIGTCIEDGSSYSTVTVSSSLSGEYDMSALNSNDKEVLKANIMVFNDQYSSFLGITYKENNSYGSGVIYKSDAKFYYALTNNHVVNLDYAYKHQDLYIEDYYANKIAAEVVYSDVKYDLAVIRFAKTSKLNELKISDDAITVRENVKSLGNPHSIRNVVSKGQVNCYSYVTLDTNKSKVDFEVIVHSAKIAGGSSGGALLNSDNEIIGITFAGVFDNTGNFITGYAIPAMRIKEFLNK